MTKQRHITIDAVIRLFFLAFDRPWIDFGTPDAITPSKFFMPFIEEVYTVELPEKEDPDSLGFEESWKLIFQQTGEWDFRLKG